MKKQYGFKEEHAMSYSAQTTFAKQTSTRDICWGVRSLKCRRQQRRTIEWQKHCRGRLMSGYHRRVADTRGPRIVLEVYLDLLICPWVYKQSNTLTIRRFSGKKRISQEKVESKESGHRLGVKLTIPNVKNPHFVQSEVCCRHY